MSADMSSTPAPRGKGWGIFGMKAVSLCMVAALLGAFSSWAAAARAADAEVQAQIDAAQRAAQRGPYALADGTYTGSARGYGGEVVIELTLENGYITGLEAVDHSGEDAAWWDLAKGLLEQIPAQQSTDVDVVSTATYTSCGIINAAKEALASAPAVEE